MAPLFARHLARLVVRLGRSEDGSASMEALILLPVMIWCLLGTYTFFDGYRGETSNIRVAYTIGDTLSRETGYVTATYMDNLERLQRFMTNNPEPQWLRVSVYRWDPDANLYRVNWSEGRGGASPITEAGLNDLADELPALAPGTVGILVQAWAKYVPVYSFVGMDEFMLYDHVATRPRFAGQLCWNSVEGGDQSSAVC